MKDQMIELMKTNMDLVESSIRLYVENKKLRSQVALLQDKCDFAVKEKERILAVFTRNTN